MGVKYYDWLAHHEDIRGDKIAIRDLDTKQGISYRQLNHRAASLAAYLQTMVLKKAIAWPCSFAIAQRFLRCSLRVPKSGLSACR